MNRKSFYILGVIVMVMSMILAACAPAATPTTAATNPPAPTNTPEPAFQGLKYEAPNCDYGPAEVNKFKSIEAVDELTVKFTRCLPDPAFPAKAAFSVFGIQPQAWLEKTGGGGEGSELLEKPIGTGPYVVGEWKRGDELVLTRNDNYWGDKAKSPTLVFRWSAEAAQRLLELQSGSVDGIDNVGTDDFQKVKDDPNLQLLERPGFNTFYIGMNNTYKPFDDEKVRQAIAMGIDRKRIVDNFFPAGSEVADYFTPCLVPNGCVGDSWYTFDPVKAKQLLTEAGFPDGFKTELAYRDVNRAYLPQPGIVAQDIQDQLKKNLNIDVTINVMESGAYLDAATAGELKGLHLLGWNADYPDQTNFLDYHFGATASKQFGDKWDDITAALNKAATIAGDDVRKPFYETADNAIKQHVPMIPVAHGASAVAYKKAVENPEVSPLANEYFAPMSVPNQDTFVWMQNAEPISLYCSDETDGESLRACEQVIEALLSYEHGGTAIKPGLATSCEPNADSTEWTCHLRPDVKFSDGTPLTANDVVFVYNVWWDAANPLHKGNSGAFEYFNSLWGTFLNPPATQ